MLWAQWGLKDRLAGDPGVWLCHQCNDCNTNCPRDAQPGDVLQLLRSMAVEHLAAPSFMGKLVGNAKSTWPLLIGLPILFWIALLWLYTGFHIPQVNTALPAVEGRFHYEEFVPHILIYMVYTTVSLWVVGAAFVSGSKLWRLMGQQQKRSGSFIGSLIGVMVDIATHKSFSLCSEGASKRRWGHFAVMWGFVGAAVTSGILVVYMYGLGIYPLPITHWVKWLGNISALALVVGGVLLVVNRLSSDRQVGETTAFDRFFLWTVVGVIVTGVGCEALRFLASPTVASWTYVFHLGFVLTLFLTFPYSKFAHLLYRTLALVHRRMVEAGG
jgi:quinone-modifying oxidoreductase subunit QmoC